MKAILNYGLGDLRLETVPDPRPVGDQILLRVLASGVCGGDYHLVHAFPGMERLEQPLVPGHEYAGEVLVSSTSAVPVGALVAVSPNQARCGVCENCRRDRHICLAWPKRTVVLGGGYAEYAVVEARQCHPLPPGMDPLAASLTEPLACCMHALDKVSPRVGETVVVVGAGANGLLFTLLARLRGAGRIVVVEDLEERGAVARELGADEVLTAVDADNGLLADVVILNRGNPKLLPVALQWCGYGARVLCYGVAPTGVAAAIEPNMLWRKEIAIFGSRSFATTFRPALDILAAGLIDASLLVNRVVDLEGTIAALRDPLHQIKTVIVPGGRVK